jgi:Acetyltransferase (GNAT) domain
VSFAVWSADSAEWLELWSSWPEREVWAHPEYTALYEDAATRALCAGWRSDDGCVLYPFLLRDLRGEFGVAASDTITPYGYGGPFFWGRDRDGVARAFWGAFGEWAVGARAVSEFVRFALFEEELLPYPGEREQKLVNVVRDLEPGVDAVWMDCEHKVRKNVKRARREGVRIEVDEQGDRLDDFLRLYAHTLERRDAPARYAFPRTYFERIATRLGGQFVYVHALHGDRVVSSELALVSERSVYSFLGGTESDAYDLRPNDLLKWELILWAKAKGKRRFVLGGGYETDDGIFRYKRSFAPHGLVPFLVGRRVLEPRLYGELTASRKDADRAGGFFPAYRA